MKGRATRPLFLFSCGAMRSNSASMTSLMSRVIAPILAAFLKQLT